ncbi:hypothetical protein MVEN_01602800 [Mycena venus]|uniref:Uncharacterized protein n=1 Tax=Mycena venus TaxID=2733690 RepID=A0A8H6XSU5_9AGAR|nr:hypothetical protein MVEN_01602800 [Mycena venus]
MSDVTLLTANLVIVVLESFLYGIYAIMASCALYFMVSRHREHLNGTSWFPRSNLLSPVALGAQALFITVSVHWLLNVSRVFVAFHHWDDGPGPRIFYSNFSHITEILKYGFLVASFMIGDSLLIHRLWVVSGFRPGIIVFPIITLIGLLTFSVGLIYQLSTYTSNDSMFQAAYRRWTTGVCICCLCTAAYTTGKLCLIALPHRLKSTHSCKVCIWYKLWSVSRALESFGVTSLTTIVRIFTDSAALFATFSLFHLVSYQCGSNIQFIVLDCMPAVVGISNLLVQIRLHWDLTQKRAASTPFMTPQLRIPLDISVGDSQVGSGSDGMKTLYLHP